MSSESKGKILHYIQMSLYNGKCANEEGFYCYTKKELTENTGLSSDTISRNMEEVLEYLTDWCDLSWFAGLEELKGQCLYTDVSYKRGILRFKRNPLTCQPEYMYLWALPPLHDRFSYDVFDEKQRRRCHGSKMIYDAIPWSWDADQYEQELKDARKKIQEHWSGDYQQEKGE